MQLEQNLQSKDKVKDFLDQQVDKLHSISDCLINGYFYSNQEEHETSEVQHEKAKELGTMLDEILGYLLPHIGLGGIIVSNLPGTYKAISGEKS